MNMGLIDQHYGHVATLHQKEWKFCSQLANTVYEVKMGALWN